MRWFLSRTVIRTDWSKEHWNGYKWVNPTPSQWWPAIIAIGSEPCIKSLARAYGYTGPRQSLMYDGIWEDRWNTVAMQGETFRIGVIYEIGKFIEGYPTPPDTAWTHHHFTNFNQKLEWEAYHQGDS